MRLILTFQSRTISLLKKASCQSFKFSFTTEVVRFSDYLIKSELLCRNTHSLGILSNEDVTFLKTTTTTTTKETTLFQRCEPIIDVMQVKNLKFERSFCLTITLCGVPINSFIFLHQEVYINTIKTLPFLI